MAVPAAAVPAGMESHIAGRGISAERARLAVAISLNTVPKKKDRCAHRVLAESLLGERYDMVQERCRDGRKYGSDLPGRGGGISVARHSPAAMPFSQPKFQNFRSLAQRRQKTYSHA